MNAVRLAALATVAGAAYLLLRSASTTVLSSLPLPAGSYRISSGYGERISPITGEPKMHAGVDLAAPTGTPVFAVEAGVVQRIDTNLDKPNGLAVFVRGLSGRLWCYLHLSEILATVGQPVLAGTQLGRVGSTGRTLLADGTVVSSSTGPHLHLQVYEVGGATVDPTTLVVL